MNLHQHDEYQQTQWEAYRARQANRSKFGSAMASPVMFCLAVAGIVCCVVAALWIGA